MAASNGVKPSLAYEQALLNAGHRLIAGVDEVGRGSLAGPVVAAAVILPVSRAIRRRLDGVRDSKQLTAGARDELATIIFRESVDIGIGWASHHVVDAIGIGAANRRALCRAVENLRSRPDAVLVDHFRIPELDLPQTSITRGDGVSLSIAAASVVAKVVRDRWMARCDSRFPGYGFARHKGYCTVEHVTALEALGPCPLHRRSFAPVAVWSL